MTNKIDYDLLEQCLYAPESELLEEKLYKYIPHASKRAKVLGVAHVDYIKTRPEISGRVLIDGKRGYISNRLDNRLGVYTLLTLQKSIEIDILLTTNEEIGQSTIVQFQNENPKCKNYNWVFMFDRRGTDIVHYGLTSKEWEEALRKHFPKINFGSYSCIADWFYTCVVNVGNGMYNEHSPSCYMIEREYLMNVERFIRFFHENKNIKYKPYAEPKRKRKKVMQSQDCDLCGFYCFKDELLEIKYGGEEYKVCESCYKWFIKDISNK